MNLNQPLSRRLLLGTGAGASLAALAGCREPGGGNTAASPTGGASGELGGSLVHWDYWQSQAPYLENEIKLFKAATGVDVKRTQQQNGAYPDLLTMGAKSGDLPDTRYLGSNPTFSQQVSNGWLAPLNDLVDDAWIKSFPAYSFVEGVNMVDGKIYSAPFETNTSPWIYLFINNQVFKDAGLVDASGNALIPKTWDDVTQYAKTITEQGKGKVYGLGFGNGAFNLLTWWSTLFCQGMIPTGGTEIDLRTGQFTMGSDPVFGEFLELMRGWKDSGYIIPTAMTIDDETSRVYFAQGQFGMTVGGVWNQPGWATDGFTDYSLTTLVTKSGQHDSFFYSSPGGTAWVMNPNAKNPEASLAWIKWLYSLEAGERAAQEFAIALSVHPEANDVSKIKDANFRNYVAAGEGKQIAGPQPAVRNPDVTQVLPDAVSPDVGDIVAGFYTGQISDLGKALKDVEQRKNENQQKAIDAAVAKGAKVSADDWVFSDWDPTQPYKYDIPEFPTL